jgi:hypothetical protein
MMGVNQSNDLIPVETNRFVYHKSNPIFRNQINDEGLITKGKSETWLSDTPIEGEVIFATNSDDEQDWFDSTYDDDIYQIDTTKIDNIWYNDPNFGWEDNNKYIITFNNIPKNAIKLIYQGTGDNLQENIERIQEIMGGDNDKKLIIMCLKFLNGTYGDMVKAIENVRSNDVYYLLNGKVILKYDKGYQVAYIKNEVWGNLNNFFNVEPPKTQEILKMWLNSSLKLKIRDIHNEPGILRMR